MSLVKIAARILEENPSIGPLEAIQLAKKQMVHKRNGPRSEAEKAILRARREWRKAKRKEILDALVPVTVTVTVDPKAEGCVVSSRANKEEFTSKIVNTDPVFTYHARVAAEVVRQARNTVRAVVFR